jgi:hypothetical protein
MKTKTKEKLKLFCLIIFCTNINVYSQSSSAPTQSVCISSTEPYVLNNVNSTSTFQWVLNSGGIISNGQGTSAISIDWGTISGGPHTLSVLETDVNGCIGSQQTLEVTIINLDDASFVLTDYCAGASNSASSAVTSGGTYVFNPLPSGSETIDLLTGEITGGIGGTTYSVEYTTNGICPSQSVETVLVNSVDDASFVLTDYCVGTSNSASSAVTSGGTYVFNPLPSGSETIDVLTGEITGGIGGTTYSVEYTTNGICPSQSIETVLVNSVDDASFVLTDYCAGSSNSASLAVTSGGTYVFNPLPSGSETIDVLTGEITGGIGGTTYSVEYTTNGICPSQSVETVLVNSVDDASFVLTDYCAGSSNAASAVVTSGGSFSFNPLPSGSETIDVVTGEISGGIGGTTYSVEYTTTGVCVSSLIQNVLIYSTPSTGPIFHN